MLGLDDLKVLDEISNLREGKTANLSISQIVLLIINLEDAQKNLDKDKFQRIQDLYIYLRGFTQKSEVDLNGYYNMAVTIIKRFDRIATYELFSGASEEETQVFMNEIRNSEFKEELNLMRENTENDLLKHENDSNISEEIKNYNIEKETAASKNQYNVKNDNLYNENDFVNRIPGFLRYIIAIPAALLASSAIYFIGLIMNMFHMDMKSTMGFIFQFSLFAVIQPMVFFWVFNIFIPKKKNSFLLLMSILYFCFKMYMIYEAATQQDLENNLIQMVGMAIQIIIAIIMTFYIYGRQED